VREFRADVVDELQRRDAEERALIDACAERESLAQSAARIRIASGTAYPRDVHLAAGIPIAEAERRVLL